MRDKEQIRKRTYEIDLSRGATSAIRGNYASTSDQICVREVIICDRKLDAGETAKLLREQYVGDLVVLDESKGNGVPLAPITDLDVSCEQVRPVRVI